MKFTVTFDRIGRSGNVAPLEAELPITDGLSTQLAELVYRYAHKYLASSEVEAVVRLADDLTTGTVMIYVGGFRNGGSGTIVGVLADGEAIPA